MSIDLYDIQDKVAQQNDLVLRLKSEIAKVVVGQESMISRLMIGLLTHGHVLLEGVPGLAKTTAIKSLAEALSTKFQRIQFTPDLLPSDLLGTMIYVPSEGTFKTRKGPIFANFVLADEINRAPSKVQSALLEAMQERQVTIGDQTYNLDGLFLVMATQNPIEQEGTYPLPEAQVDRFMLKLKVTYPSREDERKVLDMILDGKQGKTTPTITAEEIKVMQETVTKVYVDDSIRSYVLNIVQATRFPEAFGMRPIKNMIDFGASPRASIYLGQASKAVAFLSRRAYVTPQDVKDIAYDVLRHRIILTYEAEAEQMTSEDIISRILDTVPVP
ncbi:MAG: AAA family ATPase [Thermoguttaceae bacterium]